MRGELQVQDPDSGNTALTPCYCVLNTRDNLLECYTDHQQYVNDPYSPNVHKINMRYVSQVTDASKLKPKVPHCFCMTVSGSKVFFAAQSEQEKQAWMAAFQNASRITTVAERTLERRAGGDTSYTAQVVAGVVQRVPTEFQGESSSDEIEPDMDSDSDDGGFLDKRLSSGAFSKTRNLDPIRVGFCIKQGFVRKNWKKRYFVLDEDGISYYKKSSQISNLPIKTVHRGEVVIARKSIGVHPTKENVFEIVTRKRVFYIQASTEEEMVGWIQDINTHLVDQAPISADKECQSSSSSTFPRTAAQSKSASLNVHEANTQTTATLERPGRGSPRPQSAEPSSHQVNPQARKTWV